MPRVFISYRRDDSQHVTGRIYDHFIEYFTADNVFKDVDNIPLGVDFRDHLDEAVGHAGAVIVIIGEKWLQSSDSNGHRRLDAPNDFVRLEIETAFKKKLPVIPILIGKTQIPNPDELPEAIHQLAFRNGITIRPDPDFNHDIEKLASALEPLVATPVSGAKPTLNRALGNVSRELELERLDREWAVEREKYMITTIQGQTWVDGKPIGGYPVRSIPTFITPAYFILPPFFIGFVLLIISFIVHDIISFFSFAAIFSFIGGVISIFKVIDNNNKAEQYIAAENAYNNRREKLLEK